MMNLDQIVTSFVVMWAVIDPIGTVPVFIAVTRGQHDKVKRRIALQAASVAAGILLFFILVGELLLHALNIPLIAFQIAGGLILFIFALTMVFGESKPDSESQSVQSADEVAVFPLATPSIASPGAMMAVVLLTENRTSSISDQAITAVLMLLVVGAAYFLMLCAGGISKVIGVGGASIVSRVMGLILASIAATNVLEGLKEYFA